MYVLFCIDFDVDWSLSPLCATATPTPTYRAPAISPDAGRQATSVVVARTQSPCNRATSPSADRLKPLSVETYSSEVTARVESGPGSASSSAAGRDSPRPLVFDIEVGRCLHDADDDAQPLQRLTSVPRPDTPSNVW